MAAPAPLPGPVHFQIESLGSIPDRTLAPILQAWLELRMRSLLLISFYKRLFLETFSFLQLYLLAGCDGPKAACTPSPKSSRSQEGGLPAMEEAWAEHLCRIIDLLSLTPGEISNQHRHL